MASRIEQSSETPIVKAMARMKVKVIGWWPVAGNEGISCVKCVGLMVRMLIEASADVQAHSVTLCAG